MHELRPFQKEALNLLELHHHLILTAPTGSGKSLVFQRYIELHAKTTRAILIFPLVALARQQADRLRALGITVFLATGGANESPGAEPGVWIMNPEKLNAVTLAKLEAWKPNLLIVDEAHCVFEWGDGFRPQFKIVLTLVNDLAIARSLWLSATLPQDFIRQLRENLPKSARAIGRFAIPKNLSVQRIPTPSYRRIQFLYNLFKPSMREDGVPPPSGIIFCATRKSTEKLAVYLSEWKMNPVFYHAGLSQEERRNLEKQIQFHQERNESVVIVATSAFGMGMDYPFLRFCILLEPPLTLLALAQALGRVGRSTELSQAYALWSEDDFLKLQWYTDTASIELTRRRKEQVQQVKAWYKTLHGHQAFLENYFNGAAV